MLRFASLFLCLLTLACDSPSGEPPKPPKPEARENGTKSDGSEQAPKPDTCMPGGLEAAHSVERVAIANGCRVMSSGSIAAPTVITTAEELAAALECDANTERPKIDFAKQQLMLAQFSMSPAYGGSEVFDDGSKVTFVQRDRSPCPDDPMPYPMQTTLAYLLPQGSTRTFDQAACTLPARCD